MKRIRLYMMLCMVSASCSDQPPGAILEGQDSVEGVRPKNDDPLEFAFRTQNQGNTENDPFAGAATANSSAQVSRASTTDANESTNTQNQGNSENDPFAGAATANSSAQVSRASTADANESTHTQNQGNANTQNQGNSENDPFAGAATANSSPEAGIQWRPGELERYQQAGDLPTANSSQSPYRNLRNCFGIQLEAYPQAIYLRDYRLLRPNESYLVFYRNSLRERLNMHKHFAILERYFISGSGVTRAQLVETIARIGEDYFRNVWRDVEYSPSLTENVASYIDTITGSATISEQRLRTIVDNLRNDYNRSLNSRARSWGAELTTPAATTARQIFEHHARYGADTLTIPRYAAELMPPAPPSDGSRPCRFVDSERTAEGYAYLLQGQQNAAQDSSETQQAQDSNESNASNETTSASSTTTSNNQSQNENPWADLFDGASTANSSPVIDNGTTPQESDRPRVDILAYLVENILPPDVSDLWFFPSTFEFIRICERPLWEGPEPDCEDFITFRETAISLRNQLFPLFRRIEQYLASDSAMTLEELDAALAASVPLVMQLIGRDLTVESNRIRPLLNLFPIIRSRIAEGTEYDFHSAIESLFSIYNTCTLPGRTSGSSPIFDSSL